ncbi:hypothetical protein [Helicobacter colisuis]|nr:hypothetical protein [Helicobacter colisuis]
MNDLCGARVVVYVSIPACEIKEGSKVTFYAENEEIRTKVY